MVTTQCGVPRKCFRILLTWDHRNDFTDELDVQHARHESCADARDLVGPRLAARQHGRLGRLDGHDLSEEESGKGGGGAAVGHTSPFTQQRP